MIVANPALEARSLSAGYGAMAVVREIDLVVAEGEIVTLIGPNGAGKSTTLLTLAGALKPLAGDVLVNGAVATAPLHARARAGLGFVPEERSIIRDLSAADNLRVAHAPIPRVLELFPELEAVLQRPAGLLSGGEQQMLSLGRALARDPKILIADELSLGLAPLIVRRLLDAVQAAAVERGVAVVLVEQHVHLALEISDRVYVMRRGEIAFTGTAQELTDDMGALDEAYFATTTATGPTR